jgi:general secretion pathway protein L
MNGGRIPAGLAAFWQWWAGELRSLVPAAVTDTPRRTRKAVVFARRDGGIEVRIVRNARSVILAALEAEDPALLAPDARAAIAGLHRQGYSIGIAVRPEDALVRTVTLPREAERELNAVMAHQVVQLSPFPLKSVYSAYAVVDRDTQSRTVSVRTAVVPRKTIEALRDGLTRLDLAVEFADVDGPDLGRLDLLAGEPDTRRSRAGRLVWLLAAANVLLLCAFLGFRLADWRIEAARLERGVEVATAEARVVRALADKIDEIRLEQSFLGEMRAVGATPLDVLNEITERLPDGTWLNSLVLQDGKAVIDGHSTSAAELVGALEGSTVFARVQFAAPIVKDEKTGRERFRLELPLAEKGAGKP